MLIIIYFYSLFQKSHKFNKKSISLYAMAVEKIWKLREGTDEANVKRLSSELGVDPVLAELLVQRGVCTFEQARSFFRPSLDNLHDPFLMKGMAKACAVIQDAIGTGAKIRPVTACKGTTCVYGNIDTQTLELEEIEKLENYR